MLPNPSNLLSLLVQPNGSSPLLVFDANPTVASVTQLNGQPITQNPDDASPPQFQWRGVTADGLASGVQVTGDTQAFDIRLPGGVLFKATVSNPVPWGPNGEGPEGWVSKLPLLGFEWFVYTLRSRVDFIVSVPAQQLRWFFVVVVVVVVVVESLVLEGGFTLVFFSSFTFSHFFSLPLPGQ